MSETKQHIAQHNWSNSEITLFRITFIFLLLLTIPLDPAYYSRAFSIDFVHVHFQDLFQLTHYVPELFYLSSWGPAGYAGWAIAILIALGGALIWQVIEKENRDYRQWYYWLRVVIRYRLAIGLIGYGVIKLIPVQIPEPSLSDLNTAYGDFLPWKIYYLSTGISAAYYETTLGAIEIFAGLLLFSARTTVVGASIAAALLINIVLVNYAYQLGEHVYSVYLLLLAIFLLAYDTPRLFNLLVRGRTSKADKFRPDLAIKNADLIRRSLKILLLIFTLIYAGVTFHDYKTSRWPFSDTAGLANASGIYDVKEFRLNNVTLPYSATDTVRWQDVVFEKWNVLSIGANKRFHIDLRSPELKYQADIDRNYESQGNGGRAFYRYTVTDSTIHLYNKNASADVLTFRISRPDQSTIILSGLTSIHNSVYIVLHKLNKQYLLNKGRRKPINAL
jgi:hypothetical protein